MVKKSYIEAFIWLSLSVFFGIKSTQIDLGTFSSPGPGFMPFISALFLFLFSLILLIQTNLSRKKGVIQGLDLRISAFYIAFLIFGYAFILKKIGYIFSTFFLMILIFKLMGTKRWAWALGEALLVTFLSYLIFGVILGLNLPTGII